MWHTEDVDILVNDFVEFFKYVFYFLGLPQPTLAQIEMARFVASGGGNLMLQAPRGLAKSLTTQIFVIWRLLRDNNLLIVVFSASGKRAGNWTTFTRNLMRSLPLTKHLTPRSDQRSSSESFDVNGATPSDSPSVKSFGVLSQKAGSRSNLVVYDDIETIENSATQQMREKLLLSAMEVMNTMIAGESEAIVLCTPQSQHTVYNEMRQRGFKRMVITGRYPKDIDLYEGDLAKFIVDDLVAMPELVGKAVDERLNEEHLLKKALEIGRSQYQLQYELDTTMTDELRFPLKTSDLIIDDVDIDDAPMAYKYTSKPDYIVEGIKSNGFRGDKFYYPEWTSDERKKYESKVMTIDPSGRGKDETGYAVGYMLKGRISIPDFGGLSGGYDEATLRRIAMKAKECKVNEIIVEDNFGDGMFIELLKPVLKSIYPCAVSGRSNWTNKEARIISTLEPLLNQHRIVMDKRAVEKDSTKGVYSLIYQMTHIEKEKGSLPHDDKVDALSMVCEHFSEMVARDENAELAKEQERSFQDSLDDSTKRYNFLNIGKRKRRKVQDRY